jgi:hypothetical protein
VGCLGPLAACDRSQPGRSSRVELGISLGPEAARGSSMAVAVARSCTPGVTGAFWFSPRHSPGVWAEMCFFRGMQGSFG